MPDLDSVLSAAFGLLPAEELASVVATAEDEAGRAESDTWQIIWASVGIAAESALQRRLEPLR